MLGPAIPTSIRGPPADAARMLTRSKLSLFVAIGIAVAVAALARQAHNRCLPFEPGKGAEWFSVDPDSHYHMRRLHRLLVEGPPVAETDDYLNHPEGSAIPWPPYYTYVAWALCAPFAPDFASDAADDEALRRFVEEAVASLPFVFGLLAVVVVGWAAARFGGALAAGLAGLQLALFFGSMTYSVPGTGDHHAFVTLLTVTMFACVAGVLEGGVTPPRRRAVGLGIGAGATAGVLLGAWVGGLQYVMLVQATLGLALFAHARVAADDPRRAHLPLFGLAFHATALAALAPAVLSSPWKDEHPWMVVNLSWFHLAQLALGGAVFVPLLVRLPGLVRRHYPWFAGAGLALVALVLFALDTGPAAGIREGFAWAGRTDSFMAYINESQPLFGSPRNWRALFQYLGWGAPLVPVVWLVALGLALRSRDPRWLVWLLALPIFAVQALVQRRFADVLGPPLAVLTGAVLAQVVDGARTRFPRLPSKLVAAAAFALVVLANGATAWQAVRIVGAGVPYPQGPGIAEARAFRRQLQWLREREPTHTSVMALWEQGHPIEWVADRPSVGTNFGSYVGRASFLDPSRFFLSEDPREAEALLERRRARHVILDQRFSTNLPSMLRVLMPGEESRYIVEREHEAVPTERWYRTLSARLLRGGWLVDPRSKERLECLDFLRLVYVTPERSSLVWERVPGARVRFHGEAGTEFRLELNVAFELGDLDHYWGARAVVGADGVAELRVPYATDGPNGLGEPFGAATWTAGERRGRLTIPEAAVRSGTVLDVR